MPNERPFVDQRLAFNVLFKGGDITKSRLRNARDTAEEVVNDSHYTMYVTTSPDVKLNPPQFKLMLSESMASPDSLKDMADRIESKLDIPGRKVKSIHVVSTAISPEGKVRNTISFD